MATFDYNPIADYVSLKFRCPLCGTENETDAFPVPQPDLMAETHSDSINSDWFDVVCENCDETFSLVLATGIYGGEGDLEGVDDVYDVEEVYAEQDDEWLEKQIYDATHTDVEKVLDSTGSLPWDVQDFLHKQMYAAVITSLETYLGDTIKKEVLKNEQYIRNFVEAYEPFKKQEVKLSDLYRKKDSLPVYIKEILNSLLYHDLRRIKPIFKSALNIELGDISDIYKAVLIRHDIVHRNGKDKDGNECSITEKDVRDLSDKVKNLIENVDKQLEEMHHKKDEDLIYKDEVESPFGF